MEQIKYYNILAHPEMCQKKCINLKKRYVKLFPFELNNKDRFTITVDLERDELYPKYWDFFENFGYEGNGECWQGHIVEILEKEAPYLLHQIEFNIEAGSFYAIAENEDAQIKFVSLLVPIFSTLEKLAEWVRNADRERIDD